MTGVSIHKAFRWVLLWSIAFLFMSKASLAQMGNQPILLTPIDGQIISSDAEMRSTIFSWTTSQEEFAFYQLAIYPVYPCQDPLTAFRVNHPIYLKYCNDPFFYLTEDMELFDGTYVWSVHSSGSSSSGETGTWSVPLTFELATGSGLYIDIFNPCDTAAGCTQIQRIKDMETPISVGVSIASEETFLYPRALPIRAEGLDYDKVTFKCEGCSADAGTETRYYQDGVSNFVWVLEGKGSLGDPFKRKTMDSLQSELDSLNNEIAALQKEIADKQFRVDSGIDREKKENEARIKQREDYIQKLDSQKNVFEKRQDSLLTEKKKLVQEITEVRNKIRIKLDSLVIVQTRIDTLNNLLGDKFTPDEIAMLQELEALNEELKNLESRIEQELEEFKSSLDAQDQTIKAKAQEVENLNTAYINAKAGIELSSQKITELNSKLLSNRTLLDYRRSRDQWSLHTRTFNDQYPVKDFINIYNSVFNEAEQISRSTGNRTSAMSSLQTAMAEFNEALDKARAKAKSAEATEAYELCLGSAVTFLNALDSMLAKGASLDPGILQDIETEKDKIAGFEQQLEVAISQLEIAIADYESALAEYDRIIDEYDETSSQSAEELKELLEIIQNKQGAFNNKVEKRRAETEKNKVSYINELEELELLRLEINLTVEKFYEKLIKVQADSAVIEREIRFVKDDIAELEQQIQEIRDQIEQLRQKNRELDEEKERLKRELEADKARLEALISKRNETLAKLEVATQATKTQSGIYVYYIPPTLDELMKGTADETKFKELVVKVEQAKDSLQMALERKQGLQAFKAGRMVTIAKNLELLNDIDASLEEAKKKENEARDTEAKQKFEAGKKVKESREEEEQKKKELEEQKQQNEETITDLESRSKSAEEAFDKQKEHVRQNDSIITASREKIVELYTQIENEKSNQRQRENNMNDNATKLREHKAEESRLIQETARVNNLLSIASAQDDIAGIAANRKELNNLESKLAETREQIRFYVTELGRMAEDLRQIKEKITELEKQLSEEKQRYEDLNTAQRGRRDELAQLESSLDKVNADMLEAKKEKKRLDAIEFNEEDRANVDSLMAQDEDLKAAQKSLKEIQDKIKALENQKEKANADIQAALNEVKAEEEKVKKMEEHARDELKKAEDELKTFIEGVFDKVSFTTTIKLTAKDDVIDDWRSEDAVKIEKIVLVYKERLPSLSGPKVSGAPGNERDSSVCYPIIKYDVLNPPTVGAISVGNEPRTVALLYGDGELLYEKWAVIPDDAPLLAKDVVVASTGIEPDQDQILYQCISSGESEEEKAIRLGSDPQPAGGSSGEGSGGNGAGDGGSSGGGGSGSGGSGDGGDGGADNGGTRVKPKSDGDGTGVKEGDGSEIGEETSESEEEEDDEFCASPAGLVGELIDMGTYTHEATRIIGPTSSNLHGKFLWEPQEVDKSKKTDEQKLKAKYDADVIYPDDESKGQSTIVVQAGVMIETTDSVTGSPEDKSRITTRVVQGDHSGLQGETIHLEVKKTAGDAEGFGIDGTSTSIDKQTAGGGYITETYFHYGKGYGEFEITVQWKRGGEVIEEEVIHAISPLYHHFIKNAYQLSKESMEEARKMIKSGSANIEDAVGKISGEGKVNWMIFGTYNHNKTVANDIELSFKADDKVKIEPDKKTTADFGIAYTGIQEAPEEVDFTIVSRTPDKYKDLSRKYEVDGKASTKKIKQFKIGIGDQPFIVELEEEVSPGETINAKGVLSIEGMPSQLEVINVLKKIELVVENVELEEGEDIPLATAGTVIYESAQGYQFTVFSSFEFVLQRFGITAGSGALIGGTVKHEKIPDPVKFTAEIDPLGNFLGEIADLPEIEVREFKLKKGASIVIDMHSDRSKDQIAYDKAFYGLIIKSAELQLPKSFNKPGVEESSSISVEDFYIAKEGFGGSVELKGQLLGIGFSGYEFRLKTLAVKFDRNQLKEGKFGGELNLPSPMEGSVSVEITASEDKFAASLGTDKPVQLPQFRTTFVLREAGIEYDFQKEIGTLTLSALINSTKFGDIEISGFKLKSNGEVEAEKISVEKDIVIGAGFKMNLRELGFMFKDRNNYSMRFDGKVDFKGILAIDAIANIETGPTLTFEQLNIDFDKGPVNFSGKFTYKSTVFEGGFDVNIKKFNRGLKGYIILGTQQISEDQAFTYWYTELSSSVAIPIAQTGFAILELGGGLGYNYVPPIGNREGAPLQEGGFSIKALVGVGNVPTGEVLAGRMEMTYVSGNFSLYGKAWALSKEESIYGEGQINIRDLNGNPKVDGYIGAFIGLTDAEGKIFLARGRINFSFPPNNSRYVWTETLTASLVQVINAEASLTLTEDYVDMRGKIFYDVNAEAGIGIGTVKASFDLEASLSLNYRYKTATATAKPALSGHWDVSIEAFDKNFDILSGYVTISDAVITVSPSAFSVKGSASAGYSILWYSGTAQVDIDYTASL